jgi:hypothetical protein
VVVGNRKEGMEATIEFRNLRFAIKFWCLMDLLSLCLDY